MLGVADISILWKLDMPCSVSMRVENAAQVWCVAVSAAGDFAVSGGADRSLRVWRRTEEPFFVEEERERRLESLFEADAEVRPWSAAQLSSAAGLVGFIHMAQACLELLVQAGGWQRRATVP